MAPLTDDQLNMAVDCVIFVVDSHDGGLHIEEADKLSSEASRVDHSTT
jgi:hypothetical protein